MDEPKVTRVGPVHFQPLEWELAPVARFFSGSLLNAGCGNRDLSDWFAEQGVAQLTNYDIASDMEGAVTGSLDEMPFPDASFDTILCNAVLEHVEAVDAVMAELVRVLKPGGHAIVAIPFLQPYHPCPGDYRRYTRDGIQALGTSQGLEVVITLPVHSAAQSVGWIMWETALELGRRARFIAWPIVYAWTRWSLTTDNRIVKNANTYQIVFRRPAKLLRPLPRTAGQSGRVPSDPLVAGVWRQREAPEACTGVPTMLMPDELRLLEFLADEIYSGEGAIVDAGCFLGGSTLALASGLRRNLIRKRLPETKRIHSFDLFQVEEWTRGIYFPVETAVGAGTREMFEHNIAHFAALVHTHEGDITEGAWSGEPIEILFVDVAKHWTVCDWLTANLFPHLIPGRSILVQQDCLYHHWNGWLHVTMEYFSDEFEMLCDTGNNSVVYRLIKPFAPGRIKERLVSDMPLSEKIRLMDCAIARFEGSHAEMLRSSKEHFLQMLADE